MSGTTGDVDSEDVPGTESGLSALGDGTEFSGPVEFLEGSACDDGHACNEHVAHVYEDDEERRETAVAFLRQGLRRDERCVFVGDEGTHQGVADGMRAAGIDVDDAVDAGALTFRSAAESSRGQFDPEAVVSGFADAVEDAETGDGRLRVVAGMDWLRAEDVAVEDVLEYEGLVNDPVDRADCIALCQYDRRRFAPEVLQDVVRIHPHLVYDGTVCHNFYYVPPAEFLGADRPDRDVDRMLTTLVERTRARVELAERERELELFRTLMDRSNDAVFVVDPDSGSLLTVNEEACERLGYPRGELLDMSVVDVETSLADLGEWRDHLEEVRAEGGLLVEGRHRRADGSTLPVEVNLTHADLDREYVIAIARNVRGRRERERDQRELYEISASIDLAFQRKLERMLALGSRRFGLEIGFLSNVVGDALEIVDAVGGHEAIQPGETADLSATYCRRVLDAEETVGVSNAPAEGWTGTDAYERYALDSYLGTVVTVGDEVYGTLCFASRSPREAPFTDADRTFLELMGQWVSYELEREHRESQLAALNEMSRDLMDAGSREEIADLTIEHARETLSLPLTAVVTYGGTGSLSTAASTPAAAQALPLDAMCERDGGTLWDVFVSGEPRALDAGAVPGAGDVARVMAVPLASEGLLVTAARSPDAFGDAERDFVETTAATVTAAMGRANRERLLQEREETLAEQNESLERLDRVNTTIRTIDRALVQASSRAEIEAVVTEQLAGVGPYDLAWIGEHDPVAGSVTPREWAGSGTDYVEEIAVHTGDAGGGPAWRAAETREPQVVDDVLDDVLDDDSFEPWREPALDRGFHAVVALPLAYEDTLYGVLVVYADQPGVFDDLERAVLSELSDTIAYAINAVESKKALVSDEVTELEFSLDGSDVHLVGLVERHGGEFSMESVVPDADGGFRGYYRTRGLPPEAVLSETATPSAANVDLITRHEEAGAAVCLFEADLTDESLFVRALEHGGVVRTAEIAEGSATVAVDLAADADVRPFVEMIRTHYPGAELVAQRTRERPGRSPGEVAAALTAELTPRQREALQTAYASGYFESPRDRTGSEVAAALDITQPTFNAHLRAAQRKLCRALFEAGGPL